MKQYGRRFTYFVSLLVSGYLFWGRRIYIHWPIKWPLGVFNGGAAWSLLALANVCLCVIEYFMGWSKFSADTLLISSPLTLLSSTIHSHRIHVEIVENIFFSMFVGSQHLHWSVAFSVCSCVYRLHLSVDCFYSVVDIYPLFQQARRFPDEFLSFVVRVLVGITSIQAEIASLSFLFCKADGLISASLLFEWTVYGCSVVCLPA